MSRVVLVHGFTQTGASWRGVADRLAEHHDVRCPDLPVADLPGCARSLAELGPATFVGYSMGARVVLHLALLEPAATTGLVLLSGTAGITDPAARRERRIADERLAGRIERIGADAFLDEWLARPMFAGLPASREGRSDDAGAMAATLRLGGAGTQDPLWDRLPEIRVRTLVVAGERDAKFVDLAGRLASGIPDAELAIVPGAGHAAHLEQPDAFLAVLEPWLHPDSASPAARRSP